MRIPEDRPAAPHGTAGFSIIEALIAAAILLIIALGLLPLFSRSISDNVSSNDATQATNGSRTEVEELLNVPFNNTRIVVLNGARVVEVGCGTEQMSLFLATADRVAMKLGAASANANTNIPP